MSSATDHVAPAIHRSALSEFLRSPMNWFFIFIPLTVVIERVGHVSAPVIFFMAALAIIPIAALIVQATEQIALRTGDAIGGLLNATFGNAPELIIALVALKAGLLDMVRASLVGAILANLLLALGVAFFTGGIRYHDQKFNPIAARAYSTMMFSGGRQHDCSKRVQPRVRTERSDSSGATLKHRYRNRAVDCLRFVHSVFTQDTCDFVCES